MLYRLESLSEVEKVLRLLVLVVHTPALKAVSGTWEITIRAWSSRSRMQDSKSREWFAGAGTGLQNYV